MSGWRRSAAAAVLLLAAYAGLSFLNSPRGFLGTDTGGKVATLEVMTDAGRFDPDVGYWAEEWDPEGALHPLAYTTRTASGRWVNVTTLPALWVGWVLYGIGGYRLALLVPMLGSVAAAFAGRALLQRLGVEEGWAWRGFWLLGLASPLTIYALDFWEHSLGVALMAWAMVLLVDAVAAPRPWRRFAGAGALFGAAATMRTEALVYLLVAGFAAVVAPATRGRFGRMVVSGCALMIGAVVPLGANELAERQIVGATVRGARVAGTAGGIADAPASRLAEAGITLFGLDGAPAGVLLGAVFVALVVFAAVRRDDTVALVALGGAGVVLVLRIVGAGLGFVPGLAAAWVLAGAAVSAFPATSGRAQSGMSDPSRPDVSRLSAWVAVGAVPVVLATQFRGGAAPQWAGRYLLSSGFLLAVLGWSAVSRRSRPVAFATVALAVGVTSFGLAWTSVRTHAVARAIEAVEAAPEPVIVSDLFHLAREGGATYGRKRWLTMTPSAGPDLVVPVLDGAAVERFASVQAMGQRPLAFPGFSPVGERRVRLFDGVDLRLTSWQRAP